MAFQWYTFLLMNPVWNIVNSFSELQRSLAAMERVFEVLAMEDGRIVERGTHEELMRARAGYYDMVIRQMESSSENVWEDTTIS